MTQHIALDSLNAPTSRRQFMVGAAGLTFAFALGGTEHAHAATTAADMTGKALSPWVSIAPDGTISIMSPATEMGQGSLTSLPRILAEELDADWSKVRIVPAPPIEAIYGNPGFGGQMYTAASNAVTSYFRPLRIFGAQVRRVLLDNAAKKLGVPIEELTTEPSVVVHQNRAKLAYGEIAAFAEVPDRPLEIAGAAQEGQRVPADRQGRDARRAAEQGQRHGPVRDRRAGAWHAYGAVLRAPVEGQPDKVDDAKAKAIAGVIRVRCPGCPTASACSPRRRGAH
jgi:isoquinoline 1-oxidoreductase beta subunit